MDDPKVVRQAFVIADAFRGADGNSKRMQEDYPSLRASVFVAG